MATITIHADDTTGTNRTTTLAAIITAIQKGLSFKRGNKRYVRISDRVLDLSTADVTNLNFTDVSNNLVQSTLTAVLDAVEAGKLTLSGSDVYIRLSDALCLSTTSEIPG